jgi:acyl carrier protein
MNEKKLIDDGIIDSFDIIAIVSELNEEFDVQIPIDELEPDNFNTVEAIYELIIKLQEEDA